MFWPQSACFWSHGWCAEVSKKNTHSCHHTHGWTHSKASLETLSFVTTISSADGQTSSLTYQFCVTTNMSGHCPVVSFTMPAIISDCECWGLAPISDRVYPRDCWVRLRSGLWQASQVHLHQTGNNIPLSVRMCAHRLCHMQTLFAETHLKVHDCLKH